MNFDEITDRRNSGSLKWDGIEKICGVPADTGLPMWVADTDFRSADCIQDAVRGMLDHGIYGYVGDRVEYKAAIGWWMENRHDWRIEPDWIFTTHGLCNAVGLCLQAFTRPGDAVLLFTPVYHAFARVIEAAGREVSECTLKNVDGRYEMDFEAAAARLTGREKAVILCSPHNPGGRVWNHAELRELADFCAAHDLLLIADEIHHDLVFPGHKHLPMPVAAPEISDRLVMLTAPSKTFNTAGTHTGNVIIMDDGLRRTFAQVMTAISISPNNFGREMARAAYSEAGAVWLDAQMEYLEGNRRLFDQGVDAIPGFVSMPLQATYLAWVDFSATGMAPAEFTRRVEQVAKIAANHGSTFGSGGESFLRFNLGTQRARIAEAIARLRDAFADLQ